jgi:oligopeptide transport system ATP-binding protein
MKEKVLEVKNLTISFRTPNGLVRAVRDVSFDLYKGETFAIVGESGSGKSVTNRAIMGILARNGIIDGGEILYRNQDLTKLSEANFHEIRGKKIGMIFQDPLSSLNPTMKIGKQITEAMLVNGNRMKNRIKDLYHIEYHDYLNKLQEIRLEKQRLINESANIKLDENLTLKEKTEKINKIKAEVKENIAELKKDLPELKTKYLQSKKRATAQVKLEKEELIKENKATLQALNDKLKAKKLDLKEAKDEHSYQAAKEEVHKITKEIKDAKEQLKRKFKVTKKEAYEKAIQIMKEVNIPDPEKRFHQYPFQFSGGMRQRVVIAIALMADPEILICDEPTTALDVTIQGQILDLIKQIKKERDLSVIFITHDLGVVANMADRIAVMYAGKIVEYGTSEEIFYNSKHPYTWALLSSVPDLETKDKLLSIPGTPPDMLFPPKGDAFAERNEFALKIDFEEHPPFFKVSDTHYAATWLLHENAPKVEMPKIISDRIARFKQRSVGEQVDESK